ncbi:MAG: DUF1080 domain-containing protein [Chloroflexi bacterium]|nr:MAG: DUF1080 domain-containing protein [Chloroflexota bacterium]
MSADPQSAESQPNKIDFPDSLFGETPPAPAPPPPPLEDVSDTRRDLSVILAILLGICCLLLAAGGGGYYLFNQYAATQTAQSMVTSQAIEKAQATNLAYATGTARAVAVQATGTAAAQVMRATATAAAQATLEARAAATVIARHTEQAGYGFTDPFDDNDNHWNAGEEDNEFWVGDIRVENGAYIWEVKTVKQAFIGWNNYENHEAQADFDVYVDARLQSGDPAINCYGIMLREDAEGFKQGAYTFSVCENGYYQVSYYTEADGWDQISDWQTSSAILSGEWNRLEVSARGAHFVFRINDQEVFAMDDSRQDKGFISLYVDFYEKNPAVVWFDNFGLQNR